jgi:hypothetical protein
MCVNCRFIYFLKRQNPKNMDMLLHNEFHHVVKRVPCAIYSFERTFSNKVRG